MGFYTTAAAFGAGYTLGRPDGRAQLGRYLNQARELAQRPEAKRLRERGWDLAGEQIASIKRQLDARRRTAGRDSATAPAAAPTSPIQEADPSTAGFGGATVVDDSRAALGFPTLPPEGPVTPGQAPNAT